MILSVTLNPSVDHALFLDKLNIGDTNRVERTERDAGGKGVNLSRIVAELGSTTMATGFLGGGPGDYVRGSLDRQGVSNCFVQVEEDTRINFSVEDASDQPPTTFNEKGPTISPERFDELFRVIKGLIDHVRWIAVGGSLPPGVPNDAYARFVRFAHEHGVKVSLDADNEPMRLGVEAGPDFVKPNSKEAARLLGRELREIDDAVAGARELQEKLHKAHAHDPIVVISLGERGAVLASSSGVYRGESPKVEAISTVGSGDSLIGGMLWAIEQGKPLGEALQWGLACGAATASTDGSEIGRRAKIMELLPQANVERA